MNINDYKGPFLGFTFNGVHSSEFKIVRINSAGKGTLPLTPDFKDTTIERINLDGMFYFGTLNTSITFEVSFGFDNMTETDLLNLRAFLSPKKYSTLVFDETPYKLYIGKLKLAVNLSYIAFDKNLWIDNAYPVVPKFTGTHGSEEEAAWLKKNLPLINKLYGPNATEHNERIYKGEGSIQFVCYNPYAVAPYQTIEEYEEEYIGNSYDNLDEWREASRIMYESEYKTYNVKVKNGYSTNLKNVGDLESPISFSLKLTSGGGTDNYIEIILEDVGSLLIKTSLLENNKEYKFNAEKKLITYDDDPINYIIVAGDFFNVPVGTSLLKVNSTASCELYDIKYDYRYV